MGSSVGIIMSGICPFSNVVRVSATSIESGVRGGSTALVRVTLRRPGLEHVTLKITDLSKRWIYENLPVSSQYGFTLLVAPRRQ